MLLHNLLILLHYLLIHLHYLHLSSSKSSPAHQAPPTCASLQAQPALPLIGHLHLMSRTFHKSLTEIGTKYGPHLYLHFGFTHCIVVSSASVAMEIFKTHYVNIT
ncbi:hypothetical protein Patl1_17323 [Pistacia atlantica]|uniref:Uncharacterized protein n=1 Tax=Pistacia atlantica TaxID=434234 RepID=A0ACC1B747_9ROSI|nr:hypothetical protein Patl1_17323 [Pistacia atlantica]